MREIMIFGKCFKVVERFSNKDLVEVKDNTIFINRYKKSARSLIKDFLSEILYHKLFEIYEEIKKEGKIEIIGDLDFEVVERIDNKKKRIAKLKGNKILVKLNAVMLPELALKYVVAHEIAHIFTKRHTKKFWEITKMIFPDFEMGQKLLVEYEGFLEHSDFSC